MRRLRHIAQVMNSNVDKLSTPGEIPVRLCNYVEVYRNDFIHPDMPFMTASATPPEIERFRLIPGDVIITKDSEDRLDIGVPALVRESADDLVCGYHLTILRPDVRRVRGDFLFWALQPRRVRDSFSNASYGVTRYGLSLSAMKNISIHVPDLHTQKSIADFLDRETARIDGLIEKKVRFSELILEREESSFLRAVTGKDETGPFFESGVEWMGHIPSGWLAPKFVHVARLESGHTPSRKSPEYWVPGECVIPWVSLADVWQLRSGEVFLIEDTQEKVSETGLANSSARLLPEGTVVLSRTASVGFPGILGKPMATTQDFVGWIPSPRIRGKFLYYVLRAMKPEFRRLMMGSTHKTI